MEFVSIGARRRPCLATRCGICVPQTGCPSQSCPEEIALLFSRGAQGLLGTGEGQQGGEVVIIGSLESFYVDAPRFILGAQSTAAPGEALLTQVDGQYVG